MAIDDVHPYPAGDMSEGHFAGMIDFLRRRYAAAPLEGDDPDRLFCRVDMTAAGVTVGVYVIKDSLYLMGWSIGTGANERYFAVDPKHLPSAHRIGADQRIPVTYTATAADSFLSIMAMTSDIKELHTFATVVASGKKPKDIDKATKSFHRIVGLTAEMARFDGFCAHIRRNWMKQWSQENRLRRTTGEGKTITFASTIKKWQNLTELASATDAGATLTDGKDTITRADALQILGTGGARHRGA
ncbi:ribosome-inactivating family protein [Streptomyces sp. NPDC048290]|uniref:ribosome-inactivating family protein n=1 Tax=Streptomyces sp. NPDC048290 TaxID=3155811 RepID=UPI00342AA699